MGGEGKNCPWIFRKVMTIKSNIAEHRAINASIACSICQDVWSGNATIGAIAHHPDYFLIGSDESGLLSQDRIVVRADHLYERTDEFLPLLHLPLFGQAIREDGAWKLGGLSLSESAFDFEGHFYIRQTIERAFSERSDCYAMFALGSLHFETLFRGARVVPIWESHQEAEEHRKGQHLISRTLLKTKLIPLNELIDLCLQDKHNYLAISHNSQTREALIVDDILNIEENTLNL